MYPPGEHEYYGHYTPDPLPLANQGQILRLDAIQASGALPDGALQNAPQVLVPAVAAPARPVPQRYHTYDEVKSQFVQAATANPGLMSLEPVGSSYEGRPLWAARITEGANLSQFHATRPAVLFTGGQHAKEHLGVEMCLHTMYRLIDGYGTDPELTSLLRQLVIFIVPNVNPDGSEYDFKNPGTWRKNRQKLDGTTDIGIDLNRNWPYQWAGGAQPGADDYGGTAALSAPETQALSRFIDDHAVPGSERIRGAIDFHTYGQLILFPFGYTSQKVVAGMAQQQRDEFVRVALLMKAAMSVQGRPDYKVMQSANQEPGKCGLIIDWEWGQHQILAFTMELPPAHEDEWTYQTMARLFLSWSSHMFYPDYKTVAPSELDRAFRAVLVLLREIARLWAPGSQ